MRHPFARTPCSADPSRLRLGRSIGPLPKVHRARLVHLMLVSSPASMVIEISADLGIANRIWLNSSRSSESLHSGLTRPHRSTTREPIRAPDVS
jgi:hypothetical protein